MQLNNKVRSGWELLWFKDADLHPAALFRIASGMLYLVMLIAILPNWNTFFAPEGMISLNMPGGSPLADSWNAFAWTEGLFPPIMLWYVLLVAAIGYLVGFKTRLCTILLFVLHSSFMMRNRMIIHGEDLVLRMLWFYACFTNLGDHLSVDAWLLRGAAPPIRPIWPLRLMQINFSLIYALSLPMKLVSDVAWWNGELMYYVLLNDTWSRWPWPSVAANPIFSGYLTYMALLIEAAIPALIWFRQTRLLVIVSGWILHTTIAVVLNNVTFFSLAMDCGFFLFLLPEDSRALVRWIRKPSVFRTAPA